MQTNHTFFTTLPNIEDNALAQINELEPKGNIETVCIFPDIHYCSEKALTCFSTRSKAEAND